MTSGHLPSQLAAPPSQYALAIGLGVLAWSFCLSWRTEELTVVDDPDGEEWAAWDGIS
jgi:hypothetical protein